MIERPHATDPLADHMRDDVATTAPGTRAPEATTYTTAGRVGAPVGGSSDGSARRRERGSSDGSFWNEAATVIARRPAGAAGAVTTGERADVSVRLPIDVSEAIAGGTLASMGEGSITDWLGLRSTGEGTRMVAFEPGARRAWFVAEDGTRTQLERAHDAGVFAGPVPGGTDQRYRLMFEAEGHEWERHDTYGFGKMLGDFDVHLLAEGSHGDLDSALGAHPTEVDGVAGTRFAVWAPNASRLAVIGDFNDWDERRHALAKRGGVWEGFVPGAHRGQRYIFAVWGPDGNRLPDKADPLAFQQSVAPEKHSIIHGLPDVMEPGRQHMATDRPAAIYEVHLGSWQRGEGDRILSYDEIAERLVPYASEMGFTHIEFMPVAAHPFTGSWGYQPICLFAPDGRFGDPDGFRRLVRRARDAGLGVIVDWVPAHFPSDPHGLAQFDGTALYEHPDPRRGFHKDWNTLIYDFGRPEVSNFLTANAVHWLTRYGVDALRVDAVASMLYLDYSRDPGEWVPNVHGGRENLEAVALIHRFTTAAHDLDRGCATVAEESTAWPGVSRPIDQGGLGFDFKWNMGWMHDTLDYMAEHPDHRRHHHHKMTFGIHYGFTENFVLPISHDEVVHGKGSLIGKMPGDDWQRFANLRAYLAFMWTHPGKKLLFMGCEFAQEREWNHDRSLDWHLMDDPKHRGVNRLVRDLNHIYRDTPELHEMDCEEAGFAWIEGGDAENSVFSFERRAKDGRTAVVVVNMTPTPHHGYTLGMPETGAWREFVNTDAEVYGGSGMGNMGRVMAKATESHGRPASAALTLPPLAALVFLRDPEGDAPDAPEPEAIEQAEDVTNPDPDAEALKDEREAAAEQPPAPATPAKAEALATGDLAAKAKDGLGKTVGAAAAIAAVGAATVAAIAGATKARAKAGRKTAKNEATKPDEAKATRKAPTKKGATTKTGGKSPAARKPKDPSKE